MVNAPQSGQRRGEGTALIERPMRRVVALKGFALLDGGSTFGISVVDLSYDGCRIETPVALFRGLKLKISVLRLGAHDAEVRWYMNGESGLRFGNGDAFDPAIGKSRVHERQRIDAELLLKRQGRASYKVGITDLTPAGCKVTFVERPGLGERIWAKFDSLEALEGRVRWVDGFEGGIEFVRPIHPAVFQLVLARLNRASA